MKSKLPPFVGRRVVVTGTGAVTPIGNSVPDFWAALLRGESGAAPIASFDAEGWEVTFACELKGFDPLDHMDRKLSNRLDPNAQYGLAAAGEALRSAGLDPETLPDSERDGIGVIFGSGIGGIRTVQKQTGALLNGGPRRVSPFFVPMMIPDMAAGVISMRYGFRGPNHAVVTACATGNHNIGDAIRSIRRGEAEVIVTGGSDASICELGVAGFIAARALSSRNDDPVRASRPFDLDRDGFVMGEGAGALVLESLENALRRGAPILAEMLELGASADAYHMTAPHPDGLGARLALERALALSGIEPGDVDSINMHGTSTPLGDAAESAAVRRVFGDHADRITATSSKSMIGHMLGAAGAVEAIATIQSIREDVVPPTINLDTPDPACDLDYAAHRPRSRTVDVAVSNAFGFGGHNTSLVMRKWDGDERLEVRR